MARVWRRPIVNALKAAALRTAPTSKVMRKFQDKACAMTKYILCDLKTNLVGAAIANWGCAGALNAAVSSLEKVQTHRRTGKGKNVVR